MICYKPIQQCIPFIAIAQSSSINPRSLLGPRPIAAQLGPPRRSVIVARAQELAAADMDHQHATLGADPSKDPDKPVYHVCPRSGWANDGNGFVYYKGRYHMFFQHIPDSSDWEWRMCWGHVSSADLVNWEHEPIALRPTPGGPDEKGCWSGCCAVDQHGVPTILYTGVRLGAGPYPQKPEEIAVGQPVIESQCAATAQPDDDRMHHWTKIKQPIIPRPPENLPVAGFRDPYVFQTGGADRDWLMVVGSGIYQQGGALLLYRSKNLSSGWEYAGPLCTGRQRPTDEHDTGAMWECPFFIPLPAQGSAGAPPGSDAPEGTDYIMCVSPYPHITRSPTNACLYWIGRYRNEKFDLENAAGPFVLDLGDALYAPNCFRDGQGRYLMLGWFQELGARGSSSGFDYAGCLTAPRVLSRRGDRLHQAPAPELRQLRKQKGCWQASDVSVSAAQATPVPAVHSPALNIELLLQPPATDDGRDNSNGSVGTTAITVDWEGATLQVSKVCKMDEDSKTFDLARVTDRVGGPALISRQEPLHLEVFLDHSACEVFLGTGETLSTRVYRRTAPSQARGAGIYIVAHGGNVTLQDAQAYGMASIWRGD